MTQARSHVQPPSLDLGADEKEIPWAETDPRRAPLRNDLVTALQVALCPAIFWFILFIASYDARTAVDATLIAMLITFGTAFVVTWARMTTARRRRATLRSPRRKASVALWVGVVAGVATLSNSAVTYPDRTIEFLLGLCAGISAGLILLALERFAVSVPAVTVPAVRIPASDEWTDRLRR